MCLTCFNNKQNSWKSKLLTSHELFLYTKQNILGINFEYTMIKDYEESMHHLILHFQDAKQLEGSQKFHSYIPRSDVEVAVNWFSNGIRMGKEELSIV